MSRPTSPVLNIIKSPKVCKVNLFSQLLNQYNHFLFLRLVFFPVFSKLSKIFHCTGSYAMRDLVSNLPSGQQRPAKNLEEDTVVAILNTIHEIVTDSSENARSLIQAQAIEKLVAINRTRSDRIYYTFF